MTYCCRATWERDDVSLEILDTANDSDNETLISHVRWADAVILMYSITDRVSYERAVQLHRVITHSLKRSEEYLPVVIVATKADLEHDRRVTEKEGADLSYRLGCPLVEISIADSPDGVNQVMLELSKQLRKAQLRHFLSISDKSPKATLNNMRRAIKKKIVRCKSDSFTPKASQLS